MDTATNIVCFVCACFGGGTSWVEATGSFPPPAPPLHFPHLIVWGQFTVRRKEFRPKTPTKVWLSISSDVVNSQKQIASKNAFEKFCGRNFFCRFFLARLKKLKKIVLGNFACRRLPNSRQQFSNISLLLVSSTTKLCVVLGTWEMPSNVLSFALL